MIETRNLTVQVGEFVLRDVSFSVPEGAYCAVMGKTGSGKTTLVEAICGLKRVVSGQILIAGRDVTKCKPAGRGIGFVPQDGALFPMMSVRDHLEFALVVRDWSKQDRERRVDELAQMLQIDHLFQRRPSQLSGGERQRVALGRALSFEPHILCLDEPLSALDDDTRNEIMNLLKRVQKETGVTTLHVTHNHREAEFLADFGLEFVDGGVAEFTPRSESQTEESISPSALGE